MKFKKFTAICPHCEKTQQHDIYLKTWTMRNAEVFMFSCSCEKRFHFYLGKNNTWTIPKKKT